MGAYNPTIVSTALTRAGFVATFAAALHGFVHGATVQVSGAVPAGYNGTYVIDCMQVSITSITVSGTTVSVTTSAPHGFVSGSTIVIAGCSSPLLNGNWTCIAGTTGSTITFTYATVANATVAESGTTVTDHHGAPVTWNGIQVNITITDSAAGNSGSHILRWLAYNKGLYGTFQGKPAFNWPQMVQQVGSKYQTVRGLLEIPGGDVMCGVRVVKSDGVTPHPDFTLFVGNDGSTYTPPVVLPAHVGWTQAGSGVVIYNRTTSTVIYNAINAGTSWDTTYTDGTTYHDGDIIDVYVTYVNGTTAMVPAKASATASSGGWSVSVDQTHWTGYEQVGIDGSAVPECYTDYVNVHVDVTSASNSTTKARITAFIVWAMFEEAFGRLLWFDVLSYKDSGNAVINTDVAHLNVSNEKAGSILNVLDPFHLDASDGSSLIADSTYAIRWDNSSSAVVVSVGSAVLPSDIVAIAAASAVDVWTSESENGQSYGKQVRDIRSTVLGITNGAGTIEETFMAADGSTPRVVSHNDGTNRTAVEVPGT